MKKSTVTFPNIDPSRMINEIGPFDIIGDVHGCYDELCTLLNELGFFCDEEKHTVRCENGRTLIFLGDLCDRGPKNIEVLRLVIDMVHQGIAYCVIGNHDYKLLRTLMGGSTQLLHGLEKTVEQVLSQDVCFVNTVISFLSTLPSHMILDHGKLVVAHAGLKEEFHGKETKSIRNLCMYGETTGETDEHDFPVRIPWANCYQGSALVVYGHSPTFNIKSVNNTYCIDTGCVFGGKLTAFRYPETKIVQVDAIRKHYEPALSYNLTQLL